MIEILDMMKKTNQIHSIDFIWEIPPEGIRLDKGEVHIWKCDLNEDFQDKSYASILTP